MPVIDPPEVPAPNSNLAALQTLMGSPALASRRWIWEQYDHMVMADTMQRPGGDAAVVRMHGTRKSLAISCDVTPRYCAAGPREGTKQAVVESWRNLTAVGADPLAVTDNMNFGNPERPEIMGEFVEAVEGMAEACTALDFPVVSGNVSLYNETNGIGIPPTPAIGGIGLVPDGAPMATLALKREGDVLLLLGAEAGHLGQSLYQLILLDRSEGAPPPVTSTRSKRGRPRAAVDPRARRIRRARRLRRGPSCCHRRDGARGRASASSSNPRPTISPLMPPGSARTRRATWSRPRPTRPTRSIRARRSPRCRFG